MDERGATAGSPRERRILIVDDSPEDRETIRRSLLRDRSHSYSFSEESSGAGALSACRLSPPDCLLLDYDLPDLNGLEFLSEIAGGRGLAPFPIVMLTGRGEESVAVLALKGGAQDYLVKGHFTPDILKQTIDAAIEKVATRRELDAKQQELERLYAEAREADHRKDEFLAMLSHELRTPLATILNAVHLQKLHDERGHADDRMRDVIERQARHLCRLVDDLLDVSRFTRGKIRLRTEPIDLSSVVTLAVENLRPAFEARRQAFSLAMPEEPIRIEADPTRMEQVVVNLLGNASKYTDVGGAIAMDVAIDDGEVVLAIRDDGIGIAPEMIDEVFEMFAQADRSLDRSQGGLGIGLTLVRNLVQMHGGSVSARSEGVGRGSEFTVRLPASRVAAVEDDHRDIRSPAEGGGDLVRVLVVDDNVHSAESLALVIQMWGHEARVAHQGQDAIDLARRYRPQVILLDIGLPGQDGHSVARELRRLPESGDVLLLAMTGYNREEDHRRSREAGFDHHLVKPLDFDEVESILADIGAARERFRGARR